MQKCEQIMHNRLSAQPSLGFALGIEWEMLSEMHLVFRSDYCWSDGMWEKL
jgi:hypothetical protein